MQRYPPTARPRPPPPVPYEATSVLHLGELQDVETLTISEASLMLNTIADKRKDERDKNPKKEQTEPDDLRKELVLQKTIDCLNTFAKFKKKENIEAVERLLNTHQTLAKFERAQLGSLCCTGTEEAKTLIPSLRDKISDDDLQVLLNEIAELIG